MERSKKQTPDEIGSVNAAISLYGEKFNGLNKTEQSHAKAKAEESELLPSRKLDRNDQQYNELTRELSNMKKELARLKLEVATALESKAEAEKKVEYSNSRVKELRKEIEEVDEEHCFVELARIEAERESRGIEAQRKDDAAQFSKEIDVAREKIQTLQKEVGKAKVLELKLAETSSELSILQREMQLVNRPEKKSDCSALLKTAEAELKAAKKEMASIQEEGLQFMASMDVIRRELIHISKEMEQLKNQERRADSGIKQLNSELKKAKEKLNSATVSQQKSEAIVSSLSNELQRARQETEAMRNKRESISEETRRTKSRIELIETKICSGEERLQAAVIELEAVKTSEATALKQLKEIAQRTFKNRNSSPSAAVTISKSEYEYLFKTAETARAVADKKVAAARAWIVALKAEEAEFVMKTELVEREIEGLEIAEEKEREKLQNALAEQRIAAEKGEVIAEEAEYTSVATPRQGISESRAPTLSSMRRTSMRRSSISSVKRNNARSPSFAVKKRTTMMPNLAKFLQGERIGS